MLKETRWQAKYISEFFQFFAGCADKISGETLPIDKPDLRFNRKGTSWCNSDCPMEFPIVLSSSQAWSSSCCWKYSYFKS